MEENKNLDFDRKESFGTCSYALTIPTNKNEKAEWEPFQI